MKTGNFTFSGLMADAAKSVKRTYLNFFSDGDRQNIIDFFLGVQVCLLFVFLISFVVFNAS
jgi:hypothetical protein